MSIPFVSRSVVGYCWPGLGDRGPGRLHCRHYVVRSNFLLELLIGAGCPVVANLLVNINLSAREQGGEGLNSRASILSLCSPLSSHCQPRYLFQASFFVVALVPFFTSIEQGYLLHLELLSCHLINTVLFLLPRIKHELNTNQA